MKKTFCAVLVLGFMAIAGTASALPPVTLNPAACSFWSNGLDGFDDIPGGLWGGPTPIWEELGYIEGGVAQLPGFPLTWEACDMENGFAGDGLADRLQLALLAAVLCAGDPGVTDQYEANLAAFLGLIDDVDAAAEGARPLALSTGSLSLTTTAAAVVTFVTNYGALIGPTNSAYLMAMAEGMVDADGGLDDLVGYKDDMYLFIFRGLAPWWAGIAGTSAAMNTAISDMMVGSDYGVLGGLIAAPPGLTTLSGYMHTFAAALAAYEGYGFPATALEAEADALDALILLVQAIGWPDMAIYGVAKTETEPFSGTGDYDGNGDTNAEVAAAVGSDPEAFVAAASGANVWYTGNPALPVAGIFGLALLAGACVMGGAASIRRK